MNGETRVAASEVGLAIARPTSHRAAVGRRGRAWFVLLVASAHAVTYFLVGALAFATLTHGL